MTEPPAEPAPNLDLGRLWYFAPGASRWPASMAHNLQIMHACGGFARAGIATTLVLPRDRGTPRDIASQPGGLHNWYGVPRSFDIAWCYNLSPFARARHHTYVPLAAAAAVALRVRLAYTRDKWIAAALAGLAIPTTYELHNLNPGTNRGIRVVIRLARAGRLLGIVCISQALADEMIRQGCPPQTLFVAHSAVDLERFGTRVDSAVARRQLGLPLDRPVVCYAGNLHHDRRGIETLLACAALLPEAYFTIVGGQPELVAAARARAAANCHFTGHVANDKVPAYLFAADALLMPYTTATPHHRYISPLKLFEYLAAGRPIVASDFPVLREVLADEQTALLVPPAAPAALAAAVRRLLADPALAGRLSANGLELARRNSWLARQQRILGFINQRLAGRPARPGASRFKSA